MFKELKESMSKLAEAKTKTGSKKKKNCAPLVSANLLVVFLWNRFILPHGNGISVGTVQGFGLGFPGLGIAQAQSLVLCAQVDVKMGVEGPALAKCLQ